MNISYNWLKDYLDIDLDPQALAEVLTSLGLEVEEVRKYSTLPEGLERFTIGEVKEVWQHPNADRLRVTRVDVGGPELLQIVCGAPNVAAGQRVPVATVGTEVKPLKGDAFTIKKSKIRGEASEGMICAEDEMGLSEDHEGIMVLSPDAPVGHPLTEVLPSYQDWIIEIGLTPNRVDAASHIGVGRDLVAKLGLKLNWPESVLHLDQHNHPDFSIEIQNPEACPRYSGLIIKGVNVGPSPQWMQDRLRAIGLNPINNIVDCTNYVMHEMGQPMHAFDLAKIKGNKIVVRNADAGSKFVTLDKQERILDSSDLMICNAEEPMAIAGVFGGLESGITADTKDIFIESAYFNPVSVRRTARRHGLSTDASFRYERGADPAITIKALHRIAELIIQSAGGTAVAPVFDEYPSIIHPVVVDFSLDYLNRLAGAVIPEGEVRRILEKLEIRTLKESDRTLTVEVPLYRSDVHRPVDIAEDVLRIYSLDNIPFTPQIKSVLQVDRLYYHEKRRKRIGAFLTDQGCYEAHFLSFLKPEDNELYDGEPGISLLNPLSHDLSALRSNLLIPGLRAVAHNLNRQQQNVRLFKWGSTHRPEGDGFSQQYHLSIWLTGSDHAGNWHSKNKPVDLYMLKAMAAHILKIGGINEWQEQPLDKSYMYGLVLQSGGETVAEIGKVDDILLRKLDIDQPVFYADFRGDLLMNAPAGTRKYTPISRYPRVERDLALLVPSAVRYAEIRQVIDNLKLPVIRQVSVFDVYQGEQVGEGLKSYAIRLILEDPKQTLEDKAVDAVMAKVMKKLQQELNITVRQ